MKSDQDSITGAISTTARPTHHPRDAECVLMTPHIKGDMENIIQYSTITKHTRPTTNRHNVQTFPEIFQFGPKSGQDDFIADDTPKLTTGMIFF